MSYRDELYSRILSAASSEFKEKGVKAVRMDDIAKRLGISKRTLYETYPNKEDLLLVCVQQSEEEYDKHMKDFMQDSSHNIIHILLEHFHFKMKLIAGLSASFLSEILYYKKVVDYLENRKSSNHDFAMKLVKKGIDDGYFRKDVDFDVIIIVTEGVLNNVASRQLYKSYNVGYLMENIFMLFVRGVCTEKGLEQLKNICPQG